jgi:hypothetical protein
VNVCEIALVLVLDPLLLAGRGQRAGLPLYPYINDRPYVASSLLSVALAEVFKSALASARPDPSWRTIPFLFRSICRACQLGAIYRSQICLDSWATGDISPSFPWIPHFQNGAKSPYVSCLLAATVTLKNLLNHLYVLIPVLDDEKHYWIDEQKDLASSTSEVRADRESILQSAPATGKGGP